MSRVSRKDRLIVRRRPGDLETPVGAMLKLGADQAGSFLFESILGGERLGRYSFIGLDPLAWMRVQNGVGEIGSDPNFVDAVRFEGSPVEALRHFAETGRAEIDAGEDDLPPMASGAFGYIGYDMIQHVDPVEITKQDVLGVPEALLMIPGCVIIFDHLYQELILVGRYAPGQEADAAARLDALEDKLESLPPITPRGGEADDLDFVSNTSKDDYFNMVETARDYIRAGDIFQVVPSQRWTQEFKDPPFALYRSLRRTNPSPFMFFFNFGGFQVIGASPEILVRVFGNEVTIRPIAGTRPRGATPAEDNAHEADLMADQKELAEHLMLLDLGRNDVGRVSKIGSVTPTEQFIVERYSHVMHIVSNVVGELAEDQDALSAFFAGMPAGTVSGAPKVRAMEIIDELEPEKRGVYGGGCGYFSAGGDMDMCIALRTAVLKDETLYIQAGGGVVYDSDPEAEYQETVHKSNAIRKAAADARMFQRTGN